MVAEGEGAAASRGIFLTRFEFKLDLNRRKAAPLV
jgi:hypothetical protein